MSHELDQMHFNTILLSRLNQIYMYEKKFLAPISLTFLPLNDPCKIQINSLASGMNFHHHWTASVKSFNRLRLFFVHIVSLITNTNFSVRTMAKPIQVYNEYPIFEFHFFIPSKCMNGSQKNAKVYLTDHVKKIVI